MSLSLTATRWVAAVALAVVAASAGSLVYVSATTREPASAFTPGPATASVAPFLAEARAQGADVQRLLSGPRWLERDPTTDPSRTLLVVMAPPQDYSAEEGAAFRSFLERGGHALVADSFGGAGSLTLPFGIGFERVRLVEAGTDGLPIQLDGQRFLLAPTRMTALELDNGTAHATTLLSSSSSSSFLDRDGNGLIDASDPRGPFPVAAEVPVGNEGGRLLVLGTVDPLLMASPTGRDDHAALRQALLQHLLPSGGTVVVDESRQPLPDPLLSAVAALGGAASAWPWNLALACLALLPLAVVLVPRRDDDWGPHRFRPLRYVARNALRSKGAQAASGDRHGGTRLAGTRTKWTARGTTAVLGGLALVGTGLAVQSSQAALAGGFLLCAALAALLLGPPAVRARRSVAPERSSEGGAIQVDLSIWGGARHHHAELEFLDAVPPEFEVSNGSNWFQARLGREPAEVSYEARPALRGPYPLGPLRVRRTDAFRLRTRDQVVDVGKHVEIAPRREPVNRSPFKTRVPTSTLGPHLVNRAGDGSEFHSLREYQEGDSFRAINWKASARSKGLVVSQRVHESRTTLTIFLDARAVSGAGPAARSPLARGCRVALAMASGAVQVRDRVRIVLYGDGVREMPPGQGPRQVHELTRVLAGLPAAGGTPFSAALDEVLPGLRAGNPVLLVSGLEADPSVVEGMRTLGGKGLLPTVLACPIYTGPLAEAKDTRADPTSTLDGGLASDAEEDDGAENDLEGDAAAEPDAPAILAERNRTVAGLRSIGVPVVDALDGVPLDLLFRLGAVA